VGESGSEEQATSARSGTRDVFISYASPDTPIANDVAAALERQGLECWIAPRDVTPGAHYASEIVHAIDSAKTIVLILSQDAAASPHVLREIERATSKRHPVVALRVDRAALPAEFEYFLNTSQWLDASGGNAARMMSKLVAAVRLAIERPASPGPVLQATAAAGTAPLASRATSGGNRLRRRTTLVAGFVAAVAIAGIVAYRAWQSAHGTAVISAPVTLAAQATALAGSAISEKSVAVLPFVDLSENHDQGYFADGMAEELIDLLAKTQGLHVIARTSSFSFKGKSDDIPTIASKLKVSHLLEGSVRKAGGRLRITTQLVRADTGEHVWSESYDRKDNDVFRIQDEIAESVVSALKVKLSAPLTLEGSRGTQNPEAYYQFLLGRQFFTRIRIEDLKRAVAAYKKATELDPTYAAAYAELVVAQVYLTDMTGDKRGRDEVEATADRAVRLAPGRAEGYSSRGWVRQVLKWDWTGAEEDLTRAVELDPTNSVALLRLGWLLGSLGRTQEAIECIRRAIDLDPLANANWRELSRLYINSGDYPAARAAINRALEIEPRDPFSQGGLAEIELGERHYEAALQISLKTELDDLQEMGIARAEHALGHEAVADAALHSLIVKHATTHAYQIAQVYAWRNERAQALDWLERAYRQRDGGLESIKTDPLLNNVRTEPRYRALLQKMNLPL
jgi:adenylate cyclase